MLKKLPIFKTFFEKQHQNNVAHCRSLILKNEANCGYYELDGSVPFNFKFDAPCIYEPFFQSEILQITEITEDYFVIDYAERIHVGTSYDGMVDQFKIKFIASVKIEKGDQLFNKIKTDLEKDKKNVKKIMFNHKLSDLEKTEKEHQLIQQKIQEKKIHLTNKKKSMRTFSNTQVKNIPLLEEEALRSLENNKRALEKKIKELTRYIENFDFNEDIYKSF